MTTPFSPTFNLFVLLHGFLFCEGWNHQQIKFFCPRSSNGEMEIKGGKINAIGHYHQQNNRKILKRTKKLMNEKPNKILFEDCY